MGKNLFNKKLNAIKEIATKAYNEKLIDRLLYESINERIDHNEFRITIVGEFSSGKSTLLNALIGRDILPHSQSETTATLTYIHNIERGDEKEDSAVINFTDGTCKNIDLSQLKEYTTAFSKTVNVFENIEYVDIFTHLENLDSNIVLVDTPGLNGTNHYEDRTLQEIAKADASIFIFSPGGIKATEQSFMKEELLKHQSSFFFLMNRIDSLRKSEGETVEQICTELAQDISNSFFDGAELPRKVIGVSALKALVSKDKNIKRLYLEDTKEVTDEDRVRLWEESNFDCFLTTLRQYLKEEKESVFVNSLISQIIYELTEQLIDIEQNLVAVSPKENLPEEQIIIDEINTAQSRFDNYERFISKNINSKMDDVAQELEKMLKSIVNEGEKRVETERTRIQSIRTIEEFYSNYGEDGSKVNSIINRFYDRHFESLKVFLDSKINNVEDNLLLEIKQIIPNISSLKKRNIRDVSIGKKTYKHLPTISENKFEERIRECDNEIARLKNEQRSLLLIKNKRLSEKNNLEKQFCNVQSKMYSISTRISSLGQRPSAEIKKDTIYVEKSGVWYKPWTWGGTIEEKSYTYEDDSKQREYDKNKSRLEEEKSLLYNQLSIIREEINKIPDMTTELLKIGKKIERKIEEKDLEEKELARKIEEEKKQMEAGRTAFLSGRKRELLEMLRDVLASKFSQLHQSLSKDTNRYLKDRQSNTESVIRKYFKDESSKYIAQLKKMLKTLSEQNINNEDEKKRSKLNKNKKTIQSLIDSLQQIEK